MRFRVKIILILFCVSLSCLASELEAEFYFNNKMSVLKEGDVVEATLRVWPIENAAKEEFDKYLGKNLFESFYLSEILSSAPSSNNADVYEFRARYVVVGKANAEKMIFNYLGSSVHVKYREVLFSGIEKKNKDYFILSQSSESDYLKIAILFGLLVCVFVVAYKKRYTLKEFFKKKKIKNRKDYFFDNFSKAQSRADLELIYKEKDEWLSLLESKAPAHFEFFKVINQYQFKKSWSKSEEAAVLDAFNVIRGSFK